MSRNYWLDPFTVTTWDEFQKAGSSIRDFSQSRWKTVQKIAQDDYLLCYITGVRRFVGILEVVSAAFKEQDRDVSKDNGFLCRLKVRPIIELTHETALPVMQLREQLSVFQNLKSPSAWANHFRSSPGKWKSHDGEAVVKALIEAKENPVKRPVDIKKSKDQPVVLRENISPVTVPQSNTEELDFPGYGITPSRTACPHCSSGRVKRSRSRNCIEKFLKILHIHAYRCMSCGWRGFRISKESKQTNTVKHNLLQFILIVILSAVSAILLLLYLDQDEPRETFDSSPVESRNDRR